jgi:opacity protein-like surface antigen
MKWFVYFLVALAVGAYAIPSYVIAADNNYITLKPGIYSPQSNSLKQFGTGFNGEIALGHQFNPNFAMEMGVGYFNTENTFRGSDRILGIQYPFRENDYFDVVPITLSAKLIRPAGKWEFFAMEGIGAYIVSEETKISGTINNWSGRASFKDTHAVLGFHLGLGFNYNITTKLFIGAEGKYLWARQARFRDNTPGVPVSMDAKRKMDGVLATAVMGFRF